ncbi:MAG: hypothetical protein ACE5GA_02890, partial [Candidatus Zixiibacteriota bacterium]
MKSNTTSAKKPTGNETNALRLALASLAALLAIAWLGGCRPSGDTRDAEGRAQRESGSTDTETAAGQDANGSGGAIEAHRQDPDSSDWVVVALDDKRVSPVEVAAQPDVDVDYSTAVDDDVWRQMELAGEYYSMGLVANHSGNWDEAQYYFERSLKLLSELDISEEAAADSTSAEWRRYSGLLENIVASYNVTLLSLGKLPA